jgi:hypothetical protein
MAKWRNFRIVARYGAIAILIVAQFYQSRQFCALSGIWIKLELPAARCVQRPPG